MPSAMPKTKFLAMIQKFTAVQGVGPSAVRGQPKGTLGAIQTYLARLRLDGLAGMGRTDYIRWLNVRTRQLQKRLGGRNKPWGVARKAMNLFMRACLYNIYLSRAFHLPRVQRHMEIPLDSAVAKGLRAEARKAGRGRLPRWQGLNNPNLESEDSQRFQDDAKECTRHFGLRYRVFLDNVLWLKNR